MKLKSLEEAFGLKFKGRWRQNSFYQPNDVVLGTDGLLYVSKNSNSYATSESTSWVALDSFFSTNYVASKLLR